MNSIAWDKKFGKLFDGLLTQDMIRHGIYSFTFNDAAHDIKHIYYVCKLGFDLCLQSGLNDRDTSLVLAGCFLHDIGCRYDRATHHIISYGMTFTFLDAHAPGHFDAEETLLIAKSCLEHRASNKEGFSSKISELVALADRGIPDFELYAKRAVQFRFGSVSDDNVMAEEVYAHMLDKFLPESGYVWDNYPKLGKELFEQEWEVFQSKLLDQELALTIIKEIFAQLKLAEEIKDNEKAA